MDSSASYGAARRSFRVHTADDLSLSAQEWGNPLGREILFVHGLGQCHLSWERQFRSGLADDHRIVTYDLRGHGGSDRPADVGAYDHVPRWGDDLHAVIEAAGLKRPWIVAWSLGGLPLLEYLLAYGSEALSGIVLVDALISFNPEFLPVLPLLPALMSDDLDTRCRGVVSFVRACFHQQPDDAAFGAMVAFNAIVPKEVPMALAGMSMVEPQLTLGQANLPVLIIHGQHDQVVSFDMARYAHAITPGSSLLMASDAGHAPFWEDSTRFNASLRAFLDRETVD